MYLVVQVICRLSEWKVKEKVADGVWPVTEGVDGCGIVSVNEKEVSEKISFGSFTRLS